MGNNKYLNKRKTSATDCINYKKKKKKTKKTNHLH